jgi:transcriptional regulator with XRE-family HTH domain
VRDILERLSAAGWTLNRIKTASGIDAGTLSKIKRGERSGAIYLSKLESLVEQESQAHFGKPRGLQADESEMLPEREQPIPFPKPLVQEKPAPDHPARPSLLPWIQWAKPLTAQEASHLTDPVEAALRDYFLYLDQALWKISGDTAHQPIWSDMTDKELQVLCRVWLRLAQRSQVAATAIHSLLSGRDYLAVTMILLPRGAETAHLLRPALRGKQARRTS